jgi:hypothetical protein
LRQAPAQQTRTAVPDAATRLFVFQGYGATTVKYIAAEAGVSVEGVNVQGRAAETAGVLGIEEFATDGTGSRVR